MKQEEGLREIAAAIEESLQIVYPERMGFALVVFKFNEVGIGDYISNAERKDMISALRECADRLEANQDIPATIGNV